MDQNNNQKQKRGPLSQGVDATNALYQARGLKKPLFSAGLRTASFAARGLLFFVSPTGLVIAVLGFLLIATFFIVLSGGSSFSGIGPETLDNSESNSSPAEF
jgi:hypothetical protein